MAVDAVGQAIEIFGVMVIVVGVAISSLAFLRRVTRGGDGAYQRFRETLSRSILLGLEFMVAGDIIKTVATSPTFRSVGVLATIVLIRTFLSFSLELEVAGRWPWDRERDDQLRALPSAPRSG